MTAPVRDPRYWADAVDAVVDAGLIPVRLPNGLVGARFPTAQEQHWASTLTPEGRGDLRRACVAIRRLIDHEDHVELWRCASECLRDLNDYADKYGETC